jgi:anti-sigma B factor antagonist
MSEQASASSFAVEKTSHSVVVRPQVKMMDEGQLKALVGLIDEAAGADPEIALIVLDLARVTILPSLALGRLVQIANNCKARNQGLKLTGLQPQIRKVFAITHLDQVFEIADTAEAAGNE